VQCVPPPWLKATSSLSDASLLLQVMVNENATPMGIKLSCNVDAEAHGEERTGLAVTSPDSTEASSAPLSGWDNDTSPVPVSPAFSVDCMSCSHIWCFANYVCPFQHSMLWLLSHLHPLAMFCYRLVKTTLVQHTTWQAHKCAQKCTTLHTQSLFVVGKGR